MKKLILLSLILSFGILAQQRKDEPTLEEINSNHILKSYDWDGILTDEEIAQNKYIGLKPLSWDELQLYQLDSLLTAADLNLSQHCPSTLKKLENTFRRINYGSHFILGTTYTWSEFVNTDGKICIVKHEEIGTITPKEGKVINPNKYELLNMMQARILLSASKGIGFKEKGHYELSRLINQHNQKVKDIPYQKYGGMMNVIKYMQNNAPSYQLDKKLVESLKHKDGNGTRQLPLYELFDLKYSQEQKQELMNQVKQQAELQKKSR